MTAFTFDIPIDTGTNHCDRGQADQRLIEKIYHQQCEQKSTKNARGIFPETQIITFRIPNQLLERLDAIVIDTGTNRSLLLRQITSDYLNYIYATGIKFQGSLLGFRAMPKTEV